MKRSRFNFSVISNFFSNMFTIQETFVVDTDGHASSRRNLLFGNIFSSIGANLVAGVYFTSLMLAMGASESYIGYPATIGSICGLFQFLSPLIMERFPRRKGLIMGMRAVYHFLHIVVLGILPLLPIANSLKLVLFMIALLIMNTASNLSSPGMSAWHFQCLPSAKRLNFLSINNITSTLFAYLSSFLAGLFLDKFELESISLGNISPTLSAILILRVVALVMAVIEILFYLKMKEDPYPKSSSTDNRLGLKFLLLPLKNRRFMTSISVMIIWTLFTGMIGSYYSIYLLEDVKMSYTLLSISNMIGLPIYFISNPFWSRILQRKPWAKMLMLSQLLYTTPYILNAFVTPTTIWLFFLSTTSSLLISPGISLIHTNLLYDNMPEENRTTYLGLYSVLIQLTAFISQNIGIFIFQLTGDSTIPLFGLDMCNKQYMNLVTACLLVGACIYTKFVAKKQAQLA